MIETLNSHSTKNCITDSDETVICNEAIEMTKIKNSIWPAASFMTCDYTKSEVQKGEPYFKVKTNLEMRSYERAIAHIDSTKIPFKPNNTHLSSSFSEMLENHNQYLRKTNHHSQTT